MSLLELYGLAVGEMGMRPGDFWEMTPGEFAAAAKAHRQAEERREHSEWERMRVHAAITIQPHCKGRINPRRLVPLPWDRKKRPKAQIRRPSKDELDAEWARMTGKG